MTPPAPPPRIAALATQPSNRLRITWQDGSQSRHDLGATISEQVWAAALRDPVVFATVRIEDDGWQIVWPGNGVAFSAAGLWEEAHPRPPAAAYMSAADFNTWLRELGWSFAQAAEALGVSLRMLKYYASGTHEIPKTVWLACMHLAGEHARPRAKPAAATPGRATRAAARSPLRPPAASAISRAAGTRPSRPR